MAQRERCDRSGTAPESGAIQETIHAVANGTGTHPFPASVFARAYNEGLRGANSTPHSEVVRQRLLNIIGQNHGLGLARGPFPLHGERRLPVVFRNICPVGPDDLDLREAAAEHQQNDHRIARWAFAIGVEDIQEAFNLAPRECTA